MGACSKNQDAKQLYAIYEKQWEREEKFPEEKRSFFRAVFRCTGTWRWVVSNLLNIITICLSFVPTIILNRLVADMEQENSGRLSSFSSLSRYEDALDIHTHPSPRSHR